MGQLTERAIRDARPAGNVLWLGDGDGLWLRIRPHRSRPEGTKTFVLRWQQKGKIRVKTLGRWPRLTIREARDKATVLRRLEADPALMPVREAVRIFLETRIYPRYRDTRAIVGFLVRDLEPIADRTLVDIRRVDLATLIQKKVGDGPVAANRLLQSVKRFFGYCAEMGWIETSPAAALTRNIAGGAETARERVLTDDEIRRVWTLPAPHGPLLQFLVLTGARIGEAQKTRWTDIEGDLWTIPAEHSKNGREHVVQLSPRARAIIDALPRRGELVFGSTSNTAVQAYIRRWCDREKIEQRFTPHDLRRTVSTRMNSIGVAPHVVEKCLNHQLQGVMAVYNRAEYLEERREAFQALGREFERILSSST